MRNLHISTTLLKMKVGKKRQIVSSGERSVWALFGSTDGTHIHTHTHTQKKLNVSMQQYGCLLSNTSPWIVKHETHKPFLSFVFQTRKKKKTCCFTLKLTKYGMFWAEIYIHIPGTRAISPPLVTCLFIRNTWFLMDSPVTACLFLAQRRCARKRSANLR